MKISFALLSLLLVPGLASAKATGLPSVNLQNYCLALNAASGGKLAASGAWLKYGSGARRLWKHRMGNKMMAAGIAYAAYNATLMNGEGSEQSEKTCRKFFADAAVVAEQGYEFAVKQMEENKKPAKKPKPAASTAEQAID